MGGDGGGGERERREREGVSGGGELRGSSSERRLVRPCARHALFRSSTVSRSHHLCNHRQGGHRAPKDLPRRAMICCSGFMMTLSAPMFFRCTAPVARLMMTSVFVPPVSSRTSTNLSLSIVTPPNLMDAGWTPCFVSCGMGKGKRAEESGERRNR